MIENMVNVVELATRLNQILYYIKTKQDSISLTA
jgi:hypothetical protein